MRVCPDESRWLPRAAELARAISSLPGVSWVDLGYSWEWRPFDRPTVDVMPQRAALRLFFYTHRKMQPLYVSPAPSGHEQSYYDAIADAITSLGIAHHFIPNKVKAIPQRRRRWGRPAAAPMPGPMTAVALSPQEGGFAVVTKTSPASRVDPHTLSPAGRDLYCAITDTVGVGDVLITRVGQNFGEDSVPVILKGRVDSHLMVTAFTPDHAITFQVTKHGNVDRESLERRLKHSLACVDVGSPDRQRVTPRLSDATPESAESRLPEKRKRHVPRPWGKDDVKAIRALIARAYREGDDLRINTPSGVLRDCGMGASDATAKYMKLVGRDVLTNGRPINGNPHRKRYDLVLPVIPGVDWGPLPTDGSPQRDAPASEYATAHAERSGNGHDGAATVRVEPTPTPPAAPVATALPISSPPAQPTTPLATNVLTVPTWLHDLFLTALGQARELGVDVQIRNGRIWYSKDDTD